MLHVGVTGKTVAAALVAGATAVFAQIDFKGTVTLGSILVGIFMAGIVGYYATRSKITSALQQDMELYRDRSERYQEDLRQAEADHAAFEREQQEIRHQLKDQLAECRALLKVEEAKHDLTAILERMQSYHTEAMTAVAAAQSSAVDSIAVALTDLGKRLEAGQEEQKALLREIRDAVKPTT